MTELEKKVSETFPDMPESQVKVLAEILADRETLIQLKDLIDYIEINF